ncbi:hypothetical protein P3342_008630 [Pyrenophora teres f. teres]|nr:hypothetical protein P3342_008630 [Pyrenophora teres f. teres]
MPHIYRRETSGAQLSTTATIAIISSVGATLLCALALLVFRLVQARKIHKRLLADLEQRGVMITQVQKEARQGVVSRPRAVLRRNTVLPFNRASGWGALTSVETFRSTDSNRVPAHYVPAPPADGVRRNNRLSWPFSARRLSGHGVPMRKIKASRLSTVIEDPKLSPLKPILNNSHLDMSRASLALSRDYTSRASSAQSLLRDHPAFRNQNQYSSMNASDDQLTGRSLESPNGSMRLLRARSVAGVPSASPSRPQLRARSASLCSQLSGKVPDVILPPLPLDIARIKSEAKRRSQLKHAPSQLSISSFGSADTSILATRLSPIVPHSTKFSGQKITKPNAKGSSLAGGRSFRDTLDLRSKPNPQARFSLGTNESPEVQRESNTTDGNARSSSELPVAAMRAQALALSKLTSDASPITSRNTTTPKRKSKTMVSAAGSPERKYTINKNSHTLNGAMRQPKRQSSQTSSRSSGGNPFQWDYTSISPSGKPSALKGSPAARQGHRRKNSVRISLVPTIHGPPSRPASASWVMDRGIDVAPCGSTNKSSSLGSGSSNTRSLPLPPRSSTFAPELKFNTTSLRASLTSTSPELALIGYDQSFVVSPTDHILPHLSEREQKRLSDGSIFSLSKFPAAPSVIEPVDIDMTRPLSFPPTQRLDFCGNWIPETPFLQQYPFGTQNSRRERSPSPTSIIDIDEYDPETPSCIYQTPTNPNPRAFQSAFATIPEESSVSSQKTADVDRLQYHASPPVSPKTVFPPSFTLGAHSAYNLPIHATAIPEEPADTIDPSIISKDAFSMLNSSFDEGNASIFRSPNSSRSILAIPTSLDSARSKFDPLLDAAFPSSPPIVKMYDSPTIGRVGSVQFSSNYTLPSPSPSPTSSPIELPSPVFPSSPRPSHAQLPNNNLSINFAELPRLSPPSRGPRGPRGSPPRPLRSSIAVLRRMNSDAADAKKAGRGERRYLRLGREDSMQVPGDESWLDELEDECSVELDEAEGMRLVGSILEDYDEGCTMLDLNEDTSITSISIAQPERSTNVGIVEEDDTTVGASQHSSSIWEDGEKLWTSNTPPPPSSPTKPKDRYKPLALSPLATPCTPPSKQGRKRDFEVAKDASSPKQEDDDSYSHSHTKKKRDSNDSRRSARYRKRSVLGVGTPNVRIQITSPNGRVVADGFGTPVSLYDEDGVLR